MTMRETVLRVLAVCEMERRGVMDAGEAVEMIREQVSGQCSERLRERLKIGEFRESAPM